MPLARIYHEWPAETADMTVLPGVLGCRTLRRTVQIRLGSNFLLLPGGTAIFTVSRRQFMRHPGYANFAGIDCCDRFSGTQGDSIVEAQKQWKRNVTSV